MSMSPTPPLVPAWLDADTAAVLWAFSQAVRTSPHNLVSKRARTELWERHVLESAAFAATLPRDQRVLDVGSGGGFPGVVVAACRADCDVTLLDASTKKVEFLLQVAASLDIPYKVLHGRAEAISAASGAQAFDVVTARAVAPMDRLLDWTMPFLLPGGLLYAIKGESWADELAAAGPALRRWNAAVVQSPEERAQDQPDEAPMVVVVRRGVAP